MSLLLVKHGVISASQLLEDSLNSQKCKIMSFNTKYFKHFDVTFGVNKLMATSTSSSSTPNF